MPNIPNSKPKLAQVEALKLLAPFGLQSFPNKLLGIRGYYKQTMGNPVKNDIGIYDDAIFLIGPDVFASFNANTDPSVLKKGVASLKAGGPYLYRIGMHNMRNPYKALRQYGNVTVQRAAGSGENGSEETDSPKNRFWIDIHRGGYNTTSSLGCQTIYPVQWPAFIALVEDQMKRQKQDIIPYCLVEY